MKRRTLVAVTLAAAAITAGGAAIALSCAVAAPQRAHLELVSVTVDGVAQSDLRAYSGLDVTVQSPYVGMRTSPPGAVFIAKAGDRYYMETFDDPTRDH